MGKHNRKYTTNPIQLPPRLAKGTGMWTCVVSVWAVVGKVCVHIAFLDFLVAFVGAVHIEIDTVPSSEV